MEKLPLVVSPGHEGQVVLTELGGGAPGVVNAANNNPEQPGQPGQPHVQANIMQPPGGVQHVGATGGITQGQMAAVMALQADQTRAVTDLSNTLQNFRGVVTERFDQVAVSFNVVNANIRRLVQVKSRVYHSVQPGMIWWRSAPAGYLMIHTWRAALRCY